MRSVPKRPRIEEVGLESWLNTTVDEHNGHGYDMFVDMVTDKEITYSKQQLADKFSVSRDTIYQWLSIFEKETKQ